MLWQSQEKMKEKKNYLNNNDWKLPQIYEIHGYRHPRKSTNSKHDTLKKTYTDAKYNQTVKNERQKGFGIRKEQLVIYKWSLKNYKYISHQKPWKAEGSRLIYPKSWKQNKTLSTKNTISGKILYLSKLWKKLMLLR